MIAQPNAMPDHEGANEFNYHAEETATKSNSRLEAAPTKVTFNPQLVYDRRAGIVGPEYLEGSSDG